MIADAADRFEAVLIGDGAAGESEGAIEAAGGRLRRRIAWGEAGDEVGRLEGRPVLVLEASGATDASLTTALPGIAAAARARALPLVAVLDETQIDVVAHDLLGSDAQLLCAPSPAEWIAAIVLAARLRDGDTPYHYVREDEAARLARLNAEIARIAALLTRLSRREPPGSIDPGGVADRSLGYTPSPTERGETVDAGTVRRVIRARRQRDRQFGAGLFEDPAWDMMLDLFAADLEGAEVSVSSLCIAAAVAPTTALRWIGRMTEAGLFQRQPDPFDRRRALMALTDRAVSGMRAYAAALAAQGLPFV